MTDFDWSRVEGAIRKRWGDIDSLLPDPRGLELVFGEPIPRYDESGNLRAITLGRRIQTEADDLNALWNPLNRCMLMPLTLGPDAAADLHLALGHLTGSREDNSAEHTTVQIHWPSRDIDGVRVLKRHGFHPLVTLAVCVRPPISVNPTLEGVIIRPIHTDDVDAATDLWGRVIRFDISTGICFERPRMMENLRLELMGRIGRSGQWIWVAEKERDLIGIVIATGPDHCDGISPLVGRGPVAYLDALSVKQGFRGNLVGTALMVHAQRDMASHGIPTTLLHYSLTNPLSVPLCGRLGFRPLWTEWSLGPGE